VWFMQLQRRPGELGANVSRKTRINTTPFPQAPSALLDRSSIGPPSARPPSAPNPTPVQGFGCRVTSSVTVRAICRISISAMWSLAACEADPSDQSRRVRGAWASPACSTITHVGSGAGLPSLADIPALGRLLINQFPLADDV